MKDADTYRLLDAFGAIAAVVIVTLVASVGAAVVITWGPR